MDSAPVTPAADPRRRLGTHGEQQVARWYRERGYRIVEANWRCADGELDLIVSLRDTIVFCEVKTRSGSRFGSALEAVTAKKQIRIRRLASQWLRTQGGRNWPELRFDVAAVQHGRIQVVQAAF